MGFTACGIHYEAQGLFE